MIETIINRFECRFDFRKIHYPTGMGINLTFNIQTN
ncbi:Uncharacterised protein [Vibrio cholerae]|nr:Uncharacterised protein [Vibrio cholerae]